MVWLLVREWTGLTSYRLDRADEIAVVIKRVTDEELGIFLRVRWSDVERHIELGTLRDEEADISEEKQEFLMKYVLYVKDGVIEAEKLLNVFKKKEEGMEGSGE